MPGEGMNAPTTLFLFFLHYFSSFFIPPPPPLHSLSLFPPFPHFPILPSLLYFLSFLIFLSFLSLPFLPPSLFLSTISDLQSKYGVAMRGWEFSKVKNARMLGKIISPSLAPSLFFYPSSHFTSIPASLPLPPSLPPYHSPSLPPSLHSLTYQ